MLPCKKQVLKSFCVFLIEIHKPLVNHGFRFRRRCFLDAMSTGAWISMPLEMFLLDYQSIHLFVGALKLNSLYQIIWDSKQIPNQYGSCRHLLS